MPKRTSPRKSKKRIRRRIECSRCGKSYSYSGSRSHSCGDDVPESDETAFDLFDSLNDTLDTEPPEESDVSSDVGSDYCGDVDAGRAVRRTVSQEKTLIKTSDKNKKLPTTALGYMHYPRKLACFFIGFCYFYFHGNADFLSVIQQWRCCLSFLVVFSGLLRLLMRTVL